LLADGLPAFDEALGEGLFATSVLATTRDGPLNINANSSDAMGAQFFLALSEGWV
jgi:hypothetical protein